MATYPFKDFIKTLTDGVSKALKTYQENAYDPNDNMMMIKSGQKKWRSGFSGTSLNPSKWNLVQTGTGHTVSVSGGNLTITTGASSANTETIIESKELFTIPLRALAHVQLSQRVANQEFYVEFISVDHDTQYANNECMIGWLFDGTTATTNKYFVKDGQQPISSITATSTPTTASPGSMFEIEPTVDEAWWFVRTQDSTNGRTTSYVRHTQMPDPTLKYKLRIRAKNLATTSTATTLTMQFVNIGDYAELTAELTAGRGVAVAGQGIYATVGGTVSVSGNPAMVGNVAHDGVASGSPVRIGGRAMTSNYTATASADVADLVTTTVGALIVREHCIPEQMFQYTGTLTTTADGVAKTAGASGIRNYVNGIQFQNTGATATQIVIKDGTTTIWAGNATASMNLPASISFDQPLKGSSATALNVACLTTGANVLVNVQGYQAP